MELSLLEMLAGINGAVAAAISWIALLSVAAVGVIALTPTKKDDEFLAKVESIPFVGGMLKALVNFSPIKKKD